MILPLAQQTHQALAIDQLALGHLVQVAGELGEHLHLPVLGQVQPDGSGGGLHGLGLGVAAHTGHGQAHVHGGALAGEEQVALQKQLAVGDGDDVGGDIGGHVAGLGLHDGQSGHAAAPQLVGQMGRALQQTGVEIEHVAGIGLTARGALQQQAQGPIGDGVLGQVVIDDEHVPTLIHEILAQGASGVGGNILQRGGGAGGGVYHHGIVHGPPAGQVLHQLGHGAVLLADGHIDAHHVLALLVQDGVQSDGRLARLPVTDDQLALAPADGEHGVDGQQAGLHGGVHRLAVQDARGRRLDGTVLVRGDVPLAVLGGTQGIHHPAQIALSHRHTGGLAGAADDAALDDVLAAAEQDAAHTVPAQILHHALHAV